MNPVFKIRVSQKILFDENNHSTTTARRSTEAQQFTFFKKSRAFSLARTGQAAKFLPLSTSYLHENRAWLRTAYFSKMHVADKIFSKNRKIALDFSKNFKN